jgi:hypothetical protein
MVTPGIDSCINQQQRGHFWGHCCTCACAFIHTPGPGVFKKETLVAAQMLCFVTWGFLTLLKQHNWSWETMLLKYRQLET